MCSLDSVVFEDIKENNEQLSDIRVVGKLLTKKADKICIYEMMKGH